MVSRLPIGPRPQPGPQPPPEKPPIQETLLSADRPLVLLPVRLETRFEASPNGTDLLVRVYPDEIHIDTHEPELTEDEERWGRQFWSQTTGVGDNEEIKQAAWAQLAERFGPERAAWIARLLDPALNPESNTARRAGSWTRAAHTRVLPDRWVVIGYRGGAVVLTRWGGLIPDPLPVGPAPDAPIREVPADQLALDDGARWLVDFDSAVQVGMGIRVHLNDADTKHGFERLIVLGVKASLDADASAQRLSNLFDAHHYARGMAFVPQGTPTNNTSDAPSGYRRERNREQSYRAERGSPLFAPADGSSGDLAAQALGIAPLAFAHLEHAGDKEQEACRHMNTALWPATWGYFLRQMLAADAETFSDEALSHGRQHFIQYVRARGPLPAVRVGNQPYGLLPMTSLDRWKPLRDSAIDVKMVAFLRVLRDVWRRSLPAVPHVARSGDPDVNLLEILAMGPTSSTYSARSFLGPNYFRNLWSYLGREPDPLWSARQQGLTQAALKTVGLSWIPRLAAGLFAPRTYPLSLPFVQPDALPGATLDPNYIDWLLRSGYHVVRDETFAGGRPKALLYLLLRHSLLLVYASAAFGVHLQQGLVTRADQFEPELVDMQCDGETRTVWSRLGTLVRGVPGNLLIGLYLDQLTQYDRPDFAELGQFRSSLLYLRDQPVATLEQLLVETIDLCSYRLDAWVTSFATKRLGEMRRQNPTGAYIGGYGWVEDVQPAARQQVPPPSGEDGTPVYVVEDSAGFVHAPSPAQAATAAVLRSGFLSHTSGAEGSHPFAVDLSAERVRLALWLLEGLRQGQPLGALLGYRFERGLHQRHLDQYIAVFRSLAPLVANKIEAVAKPVESLAARNVVDGLALDRLWKGGGLPWGNTGLPPASDTADYPALNAELEALDKSIDAVTDVAMAESVYQIVQGNSFRAGALLDAISRGEAVPPEPEVVRTPRTGIGLTHRIMVFFGGAPAATPGWATAAYHVRAQAEPCLNAWAAGLLGDPTRFQCQVVFSYEEGQPPQSHTRNQVIHLSDLELSPADVLYLSEDDGSAQPSDLEQHLLYYLGKTWPADIPIQAQVQLLFERHPDWGPEIVSFAELVEVARTALALIRGARAVEANDLKLPEQTTARDRGTLNEIDIQELGGRAETAVLALQQAHADLVKLLAGADRADVVQLSDVLLRLSYFGIPGSVPVFSGVSKSADQEMLLDQARSIEREAEQRLEKAVKYTQDFDETMATPKSRRDRDIARLRCVFGDAFQVLPRIKPTNAADLQEAFAASNQLVDNSPSNTITWFQRVVRIREGAARLDTTLMYAEALGSRDSLTFVVGQLPFQQGDRWVALPPTTEKPLQGGRLSLVVHSPTTIEWTKPLAGLFIDEWTEVVPNASELTGLALQFNQPDACAPQAILLAVPPDDSPAWNLDTLATVALETLEWAKLRAVDPDALGELGHFLPALYFADNVSNQTVATNFARDVLA